MDWGEGSHFHPPLDYDQLVEGDHPVDLSIPNEKGEGRGA